MKITMQKIAEKAGVSKSAVSKVLNNRESYISQATRDKILAVCEELNYKPNFFAQSLNKERTNIIAVATLERSLGRFAHVYPSHIYQGIGDFFSDKNNKLIFKNFQKQTEPNHYMELVESRLVDGIIFLLFSAVLPQFKENEMSQLQKAGIPFVVIHSMREDLGCAGVGMDGVHGGSIAAEHLVKHDYKTIGLVKLARDYPHCTDLAQGFMDGLEHFSRRIDKKFIFTTETAQNILGYQLADQLVKDKQELPQALFTVDDGLATGMIRRFNEAGIKVPGDIAIIGFSDLNPDFSDHIGLTSVKQPAEKKGFQAGEMIYHLLNGKEKKPEFIVVKPELTIRKSCGCP
jgi:LacI family transcriptional regulator